MNFKVLDFEMLKNDNLGFTISGKMETYLRVENVNPIGLAFKAGLKQDDYIIMINGIKIKGRNDIINSVNESRDKLQIKVIRYNNFESKERCIVQKRILKLDKRSSSDFQSLHHNLLSTMGSKVGMEITRSCDPAKDSQELKQSKLIRRSSTNSECYRRQLSSESKTGVNISQYHAPIKKHGDNRDSKAVRRRSSDLQNTHSNRDSKIVKEKTTSCGRIKMAYETGQKSSSIDIPSRQLSHDSFNTTQDIFTSPYATPPNAFATNLIPHTEKNDFYPRNLSLRQKKAEKTNLLQCNSLSNINIHNKSICSSPLTKDVHFSRKLSAANASSMASLFEEEHSQSVTSEYIIDWKAIFLKISEKTSSEIELSLINYFHNVNNNLTLYPAACLYRFLTYDDVLSSIFNNILSSDFHVDFNDEILKTSTHMIHVDYDINACNIIKLIKCNIKRVSQLIEEYQERKNNFKSTLEKWKDSLDPHLKNPDYSVRMHSLISSICTKLEMMNNTVIIVVQLLSRWKLSKEFPYLYQNYQNEKSMLRNCENTFSDFRQSQKKLELQMVNLIRLFKEDKCEEVLKLVSQIFSENMELHLFLPIFKNKLNNDSKVLAFLENTPKTVPGPEQFV